MTSAAGAAGGPAAVDARDAKKAFAVQQYFW